MKRSTKWPGSSLTERFSLENPSVGCCPAIFYSFRWPAPEKEQVLCLPSFRGYPKRRNIRSISEFSTFHVLSKIWRLHMSFNNGNERRKLNAKWEHLRVQYREAGMSEDAIQAMYEFDLGVLTTASSVKNGCSVRCATSTRSIFTASGRTTPQSCADGKNTFSPSTPPTTASAEKTHCR